MDLTWLINLELVLVGLAAGAVGAMTGLGGGLIITPLLTLFFHVPIHQAIGTSLCCVIATSAGAAASYVEERLCDVRLGITLELATTLGALGGSLLAGLLSRQALAVIFAAFLAAAGISLLRRRRTPGPSVEEDLEDYRIARLPLGLAGSGGAGIVSGLLGVGGGIVKVPLMYLVMGIPFKVATATSNFMIGVTAAAGAFVYYARGEVVPLVAAPTAVGVFAGAWLGSHLMRRTPGRRLVVLFSVLVFYFAVMMIWRALFGSYSG
jgi:hypothetical protein